MSHHKTSEAEVLGVLKAAQKRYVFRCRRDELNV